MRLYTPLTVLATTFSVATAELASNTDQWIVVDIHGGLLDIDPTPYLPASRLERKHRDEQARIAAEASKVLEKQTATDSPVSTDIARDGSPVPIDTFFDDDESVPTESELSGADEQVIWSATHIPDIETLMVENDHDVWLEELEATAEDGSFVVLLETNTSTSSATSFWGDWARVLEDDSAFPTVQSSVVFAELSCLFVLFIGYLVLSIPLWPSFSRGQKCCLFLAFAAAGVYQIVALCWYFGGISPDITLSISSLITRTISLGMVPITTTSFMGRARLAAEEKHNQKELGAETQPTYPPSRHRRAKAKAAAAAAAAAAASNTTSAPAEKA